MSAQPPQPIIDISSEMLSKLMEHCESCRLFVTFYAGDTEETASFSSGSGNLYAQLGQVREWLIIQEQHQREYAKRDKQ